MSGLAAVLAEVAPDFAHGKVGKGWHENRWSHECRCGRFFPKMQDWCDHRYAEFAAAVTAWIEERLASDEVREAVADCGGLGDLCSHTGPVVNDGCEDCRALANAALTAVGAALRGGA